MSRRFFAGGDGAGGFAIRQAKPGYDALTSDLDGLLFDSDFFPGRVLARGDIEHDMAAENAYLSLAGAGPKSVTVGHGAPRAPDVVAAVAIHLTNNGLWTYRFQLAGTSYLQVGTLQNPNMQNRHCTPFTFIGNNTGGAASTGAGGSYFGGWWFSFDAGTVTLVNNTAGRIRMRWAALEL